MRLLLPMLAIAGLALPATARAQLQFAGDAPRVYTIEPREHRFKHEVQLGLGVLPLDAFYIGTVGSAGYSYHFSERWAWQVVNGLLSKNFDTSLRSDLLKHGVEPSQEASRRISFILSSNAVVTPMFGKITLFNDDIVQSQTDFTAGLGAVVSNEDTRFALNFGGGLHFWVSQNWGIRFDVRDYLVFNGLAAPGSVLLLALSGSLNFSVRLSDPEPVTAP